LSFALIVGILSGTYSSIFVATPVMMFLRGKYYEEENERDL
jgi:preprotein translocase subunit SecF